MIENSGDKRTEDIFNGIASKKARSVPTQLHAIAQRKLDYISAAGQLDDMKLPPGNNLESLKGALKGFFSIPINDQWRIIFRWHLGNAFDVQICDYH